MAMNNIKVLYFHGGPGLNSNPESKLLSPKFKELGLDLNCWNEPSLLRSAVWPVRPESSYSYYLSCAEAYFLEHYQSEPLFIIGHSFGVHAVSYLIEKFPDKIKKAFFIASDFDTCSTDLNMFNFVMNDFKKTGDVRHTEMNKVIQNYTGKFDDNFKDGFLLYVKNENWYNYYWNIDTHKMFFLSCFSEPGFTFDFDSFWRIRKHFVETELYNSKVPAVAFFGKFDKLISYDKEVLLLRRRFESLQIHIMEESAHYPHVEETEKLLAIIEKEISTSLK
jgi:pimeloyl-ACP methyl ester carboxylesterase